ncbi:MAG TPA: N-acetylmuramoyl-L-alanine amidase, partial [Planctomycetaceae bacterium]|nr:N-acetylmuramoyl-L-alanine amidase [Planctomycetaceae bacterium]
SEVASSIDLPVYGATSPAGTNPASKMELAAQK